ncbi:MAG: phosphatidylserine/phosphatidylglycerophosphate/cardiolipin synthase family protein [Verrucomicrobium sp.]|nr:phospholipase D-like domain-containing protein [Verrucomicrobium sp.]
MRPAPPSAHGPAWAFLKSALTVAAVGVLSSCSLYNTIKHPLPHKVKVSDPAFRQQMTSVLGPSWESGNKVTPLSNGDQIFPAMLSAIRNAKQTINFETYVYWDGDIPEQFAKALAERAQAGVQVRVLLDGHGCMRARRYSQMLLDAGVQLEVYHPLNLLSTHRANYRTHRKLLIVDGKVGFIGGVGIADEWKGDARNENEWREMHYKVEGPVVAQLQGIFADNWLDESEELIQGPTQFPVLSAKGNMEAAGFMSSPMRGRCNMEIMFHTAIASASKSILITTPYFIPDKELTTALCNAAKRGVKVAVLMPGRHIDSEIVRRASRRKWPQLMEAGIELFEYQPTMIHSKVLVVDDLFVSVGSANFDPRSLRINDEANLNVLDKGFADYHTRLFLKDLRKSKQVKIDGGLTEQLSSLPFLPLQWVEMSIEGQL